MNVNTQPQIQGFQDCENPSLPLTGRMLDGIDFSIIEAGHHINLPCSQQFEVGSTVFVGERGWYDSSTTFISATPVGIPLKSDQGTAMYLLYYGTLELDTAELYYRAYGAFRVKQYHSHSKRIVLYPLFCEGREAITDAMEAAGYGTHAIYAREQWGQLKGGQDVTCMSEAWAAIATELDSPELHY